VSEVEGAVGLQAVQSAWPKTVEVQFIIRAFPTC
jgi:hypothetical protein